MEVCRVQVEMIRAGEGKVRISSLCPAPPPYLLNRAQRIGVFLHIEIDVRENLS
jgi:hypothetical protein